MPHFTQERESYINSYTNILTFNTLLFEINNVSMSK